MMGTTADKLFLFAPDGWSYCGGATLICAATLEKAMAYGNQGGNEIAEGGKFVATEAEQGDDRWLFIEVFQLAQPRATGIVFSEANYA